MAMTQLDKISIIINSNTLYDHSQFTSSQLSALASLEQNPNVTNHINFMINPEISDITYYIMSDYYDKFPVNEQEFNQYIKRDVTRMDEMLQNILLGKLNGLSQEMIDIYAQPTTNNIKICRLICEKCKDKFTTEELKKLCSGKFATGSVCGKLIIQDVLKGELKPEHLFAIQSFTRITQDQYEYILKANHKQLKLLSCATYDEDFNYIDKLIKVIPADDVLELPNDFYANKHWLDIFIEQEVTFSDNETYNSFIKLILNNKDIGMWKDRIKKVHITKQLLGLINSDEEKYKDYLRLNIMLTKNISIEEYYNTKPYMTTLQKNLSKEISKDEDKLKELTTKLENNLSEDQLKELSNEKEITEDVIIRFCEEKQIPTEKIVAIIPTYVVTSSKSSSSSSKYDYDDYDEDDYVDDDYIEDSFDDSSVFQAKNTGTSIALFAKDLVSDPIIQFKKVNVVTTSTDKQTKDEYLYLFEIINKHDEFHYECKVKTKKDVIKAIDKTIMLIDGVKMYQKYVSELEDRKKKFE